MNPPNQRSGELALNRRMLTILHWDLNWKLIDRHVDPSCVKIIEFRIGTEWKVHSGWKKCWEKMLDANTCQLDPNIIRDPRSEWANDPWFKMPVRMFHKLPTQIHLVADVLTPCGLFEVFIQNLGRIVSLMVMWAAIASSGVFLLVLWVGLGWDVHIKCNCGLCGVINWHRLVVC